MHNVEHYTFDENVNKKSVQDQMDQHAAYEDRFGGCSGLCRNIRWLEDAPCANCDEALKKIERLDRGDYDQLAVKYYSSEKLKTPKLAELEAKADEARKKYFELDKKVPAKDFAATLVGCKCCGSKIAREYIDSNRCPVCGRDMRSDTLLKQIQAAKTKAEMAQGIVRKYIDKHAKKSVKWLVKIEYHT